MYSPCAHPHPRLNSSQRARQVALSLTVLALSTTAINALASTLTTIPPVPWGTNTSGVLFERQNEARAITPDGKFVVGINFQYSYTNGSQMVGFFYNVTNNTLYRPAGGSAVPNILTGIGYRTEASSGTVQVVLDGMSSGYQANWMTSDGGVTWGAKRRNTAFTAGITLPKANSLAATKGSDMFYCLIGNAIPDMIEWGQQRVIYIGQGYGPWNGSTAPTFSESNITLNNPNGGDLCGVSALTGRAVGWYQDADNDGGIRHSFVVEYPPDPSGGLINTWNVTGLDGTTRGAAFCITQEDGTNIFGNCPTYLNGPWHGYKAVVGAYAYGTLSVAQLPDFADTGNTNSRQWATPFGCSDDGRYAAGNVYRSSVEKAVLWDTGDPDTNNWSVVDLTDLAAKEGLLGSFAKLERAYSVGVNDAGYPVVAGYGKYLDGTTLTNRAFVMTVTLPPRITSITGAGTSAITVNYASTLAGKTYTLQSNTDLSNPAGWQAAGSKLATGTSDSQTESAVASGRRFYRVIYTP